MKKVKTAKEPVRQITQGHVKMMRYIDDLIRTKDYQKAIKKLRKVEKHYLMSSGKYKDWTLEEQKKHDAINAEFASIIRIHPKAAKRDVLDYRIR